MQRGRRQASSLEVLYALGSLHFTRADRDECWRTVRELAELSSRAGPVARAQGLFLLGATAVWSGDHRAAASAFGELQELERDDTASAGIFAGFGVAPMVSARSNLAYHLYLTGRADEARAASAQVEIASAQCAPRSSNARPRATRASAAVPARRAEGPKSAPQLDASICFSSSTFVVMPSFA